VTDRKGARGTAAILWSLRRDRIAVATLVVWALGCLPYALPLGRVWLDDYQAYVLFPLLIAMVVLASFSGVTRLELPQERQFWTLIGAAFGIWLISYVPYFAVAADSRSVQRDLVDDLFYLGFYLCLLLALEVRPHLATTSPIADRERWIKSLGTTLLALASLGYFVLVPAALAPQDYASWVPSYYLYLAFDAFLLARLAALAAGAGSARWRLLYGALAASTLLMLAVDALELADRLGVMRFESGAATDVIWTVPLVAYAWSARLRHQASGGSTAVPFMEAFEIAPQRTGSYLLLCAMALPGAHLVLYPTGLLDPSTHAAREWVVLGALLALGALAAVTYRLLERDRLALRARQQRLESRLRRMERTQAAGRLAEGLAHEFGNLLQVIGGRAEALRSRVPDASPLREDLEAVRDASKRMARLTAPILDLVRADSAEPRLVRLSDIARDVEPLLHAMAGDRVAVEIRLKALHDVVRVDAKQIERAIVALAANACEAMPGRGSLTVEVFDLDLTPRLEAQLGLVSGPYAALSLTDTGSGMSEATLARAFEPFFTTRPEAEHAGLGLTSALHVASCCAGTVQIESVLGRGTTVTLYLPRAESRVIDTAPAGSIEDTLRRGARAARLASGT
jgi:signal transduction histidine kinase